MGKTSEGRRAELSRPSCLDFIELRKQFLEGGQEIISRAQLDIFIRSCLSSDAAIELMDALVHCSDHAAYSAMQENIAWASLCPSLPQRFYEGLRDRSYRLLTMRILEIVKSQSNDTVKILLETQDGHKIEACLMRFGTENPSVLKKTLEPGETSSANKARATVCVSSQVGCKMACSFCATGTLGLQGNLTTAEILEQIAIANIIERKYRMAEGLQAVTMNRWLRNVVFMGMGEPLDNYDEVVRTVKILTSQHVMSFAPSRVTISTVGFSPRRIRTLKNDVPRVSLALSLHAPTPELRSQLVPTAKGVNLEDLMAACFEFVENQKELSKSNAKRQALFIEYCLIDGVNDSVECAKALAKLLESHKEDSIINVIPYNPTEANTDYHTPSDDTVERFMTDLRQEGLRVYVRHEFGRDISGACGQLAAKGSTVQSTEALGSHMTTTQTPEKTEEELIVSSDQMPEKDFILSRAPIGEPDRFAAVARRSKGPQWSHAMVAIGAAFVIGISIGKALARRR